MQSPVQGLGGHNSAHGVGIKYQRPCDVKDHPGLGLDQLLLFCLCPGVPGLEYAHADPCPSCVAIPSPLGFRFIKILDSVLHHLVPAWDHTVGTFSKLKVSNSLCVLWGLSLTERLHLGCGRGGSQCSLPLQQLKENTWLNSGP